MNATATVTLFYTDNIAEHYGLGDVGAYRAVHVYDTNVDPADALAVCDAAFVKFNRGSGREDPALDAKELRSLSVGDIVKITFEDSTSVAYRCASFGWDPIESWKIAPEVTA